MNMKYMKIFCLLASLCLTAMTAQAQDVIIRRNTTPTQKATPKTSAGSPDKKSANTAKAKRADANSSRSASSDQAIASKDLNLTRLYAEQGDAKAMAQLGDIYRWGLWNVTDTLQLALHWYTLAGEAGDAESWFKLGCINQLRDDKEAEAIDAFRKAARGGYEKAWYYLGELLRYDQKEESYLWMRKADSIGDLRALGMISEGWYDDINPSIKTGARSRIKELADKNHPEAIGIMAGLYLNGFLGQAPRDIEGARKWALKGMELNDPDSYTIMGITYDIEEDEKEADKYFEIGAAMGDVLCMAHHSWASGKYQRMRFETLFFGKKVMMDGMGIYDASEGYLNDEDKKTWHRRMVEYGHSK